tara:strand:- start:412 stop:744 length:333 start_codon:yes stop_codon:yes gene_type:complete
MRYGEIIFNATAAEEDREPKEDGTIDHKAGDVITEYRGNHILKTVYSEPPTAEEEARILRDQMLRDSDSHPAHLVDHPDHEKWKTYRTALRDWPKAAKGGFPDIEKRPIM